LAKGIAIVTPVPPPLGEDEATESTVPPEDRAAFSEVGQEASGGLTAGGLTRLGGDREREKATPEEAHREQPAPALGANRTGHDVVVGDGEEPSERQDAPRAPEPIDREK
jgi:hypothetical protein